MIKTYVVKDPAGLHARPASLLVKCASNYEDECYLNYKEKRATLKSLLLIMSMGVPNKAEFSIEIIGEHAEEIHKEMEKILLQHEVI
jgi:phosphocarrier protein